jgi:hypothetical protein
MVGHAMPDMPGRPQHDPMCGDETMMKWQNAVMPGEKPNIDRAGLSYMLMGEARQGQNVPQAKDPTKVKEWFYIGPHIMIVLPDSDMAALRDITQDLSRSRAIRSLWKSAGDARSRHCPSSRMSCFLAAELSSSLATKPLVQLARAALQEPSWMTLARALD